MILMWNECFKKCDVYPIFLYRIVIHAIAEYESGMLNGLKGTINRWLLLEDVFLNIYVGPSASLVAVGSL